MHRSSYPATVEVVIGKANNSNYTIAQKLRQGEERRLHEDVAARIPVPAHLRRRSGRPRARIAGGQGMIQRGRRGVRCIRRHESRNATSGASSAIPTCRDQTSRPPACTRRLRVRQCECRAGLLSRDASFSRSRGSAFHPGGAGGCQGAGRRMAVRRRRADFRGRSRPRCGRCVF